MKHVKESQLPGIKAGHRW